MLGFEDFIWKNHSFKNIEENSIDEIYCIIKNKENDSYIKYGIKMQFPMDENYIATSDKIEDAKYFIVFVSTGRDMMSEEIDLLLTDRRFNSYKGGYGERIFEDGTFQYVATSLDEAKRYCYEYLFKFMEYPLSYVTRRRFQTEFDENFVCES